MRHLTMVALAATGMAVADVCAGMTTYYVDPVNGKDSNSGKSPSSSVQTIKRPWDGTGPGSRRDCEIVLLPGVYSISNTLTIYNGDWNRVLRGSTGNPADVTLQCVGSRRLFSSQGGQYCTNYTFRALTIRDFASATDSGGAICVDSYQSGTLHWTFDSCVFENCSCAKNGGAILFGGTDLVLTNCTFRQCSAGGGTANSGGGGAVYFARVNSGLGPAMSLYDCRFEGNFTTNAANGGALYFGRPDGYRIPQVRMERCKFIRNRTENPGVTGTGKAQGGALYGMVAEMYDCEFVSNRTSVTVGTGKNTYGGVWSLAYVPSCTARVERCTFIANHTDGSGLIYDNGTSSDVGFGISFKGCLFEGNTSFGTLLWAHPSVSYNNAFFGMEDCVVKDNKTSRRGKYDFMSVYSYATRIRRCRFEGNECSGSDHIATFNVCANGDYTTWRDGVTIEDCKFIGNKSVEPEAGRSGSDMIGVIRFNNAYKNLGDIIIRNCLFDGNINSNYLGGAIVQVGNNASEGSAIDNCTFVNNTAWTDSDPGAETSPYGGVHLRQPDGKYPVSPVRNCIFSGNHREGHPDTVRDFTSAYTKAVIDCCLFESAASGGSPSVNVKIADGQQHCIVGFSPKFTDAEKGDYTLTKSSPARDVGLDQPWMFEPGAHDLALVKKHGRISARIVGDHVDLGCYEWSPDPGLMLLLR